MIDKSVPWWTRSKTFEASRKTAWTRWFASSAVCQSSIHCNNCHSADLPRRKPNWSSAMMLFEKQWVTNCLWTNFSKTFDRELKSATGRYDCGSEEGFPLFSIGVIMAFFQLMLWKESTATVTLKFDYRNCPKLVPARGQRLYFLNLTLSKTAYNRDWNWASFKHLLFPSFFFFGWNIFVAALSSWIPSELKKLFCIFLLVKGLIVSQTSAGTCFCH